MSTDHLRLLAFHLLEACRAMLDATKPILARGLYAQIDAASLLRTRLSCLLIHLGDIALYGLPEPCIPALPAAPTTPTPLDPERPARAPTLRPHRGWLREALPDLAPFIGDLRALLADPDMPQLLAADPALRRLLTPLLHDLGLKLAPESSPDPTPDPTPQDPFPTPSSPTPTIPPQPDPPSNPPPDLRPNHAQFIAF